MEIEKEIGIIKDRNERVESDKAWETSSVRKAVIALTTYVVAVVWLFIIGETAVWVKAVVPVAGYLLSTMSIPVIKEWWLKYVWKK